jgi:methylated-DNA-[protein]-cysteine S-methyltransferase
MFHAQLDSPLGPILLCAHGGGLAGLYFVGQSDCPVVDGLPAARPAGGGPSHGELDGRPIRGFRARPGRTADLFDGFDTPPVPGPAAGPAAGGLRMLQADTPQAAAALFDLTARQIDEYFAGRRRAFDVPLDVSGTDFQKRVWNALLRIPYGKAVSYGDVACDAGLSAQHGRPVGTAVGRNPVTIIIPCHRVLSHSGRLTGYTGGLSRKLALLELEGFELS